MGEFPGEQFVKESVRKYLESQDYQVIIKEPTIKGGKPDFLAYKWRDEGYGIEYLIVECKDGNDLKVKQFIDIIQKQISKYQARYPNVHLAIPVDDSEDKQFYVTLCKFHRVGLLVVNKAGEIERTDPERPASVEVQDEMGKFYSFAAGVLGFLDVFKGQQMKEPELTWVSTSGTLQYQLLYDGEQIRFGVNAEDAKKLKVRISHKLLEKLRSEASEYVEILVRRERYPLPRQREYFVVLKKPLRLVNSGDIEYIVNLVESSKRDKYNAHINFSIPLWKSNQLFGKQETIRKIKSAKKYLRKFYVSLS